jgi:hypothetical protein
MGKAELEQLETWATSAIEAATGIVGEREIARHLASQASADATRKACFELLGRAPAVAAFAEELVARRGFVRAPAAAGGAPGGASQREKQRQRAARLKQGDSEKAPLNCLRCGFANAVDVARAAPDVAPERAYADAHRRLGDRAAAWGRCAFCGDDLAAQADPAPCDRAEALARRLVQYDRESARRTHVIDDQQDWYAVATSAFSSPEEAAAAWDKEERRRENARKSTFKIDFAGRRVVETEFEEEEALFQGRAEPRVAAGDAPDEVCGAPDAVSV